MAAFHIRQIFFLYLIFFCRFFYGDAAFGSVVIEEEEFSEELLLRPLPDRKVLAHFHFESRAPPTGSNGRHHHLFPKAISQLVHKFRIKEMELSFTQGRWNYETWGGFDPIPSNNAKPPGVELWAVFDVPQDQLQAVLGMVHCRGRLFCTENLTPWLKLLPCRDKDGIAALVDRPSIYKGFYHSQRLHLTSTGFDSDGVDSGIILEQTLTLVLQPPEKRAIITSQETKSQPSWFLTSIFGREVNGRCVLAKSSHVYLQLDQGLVAELDNLRKENEMLVADFIVEKYSDSQPFDLGLTWKLPVVWSCQQAPLHASRFLMGSGNERCSLMNNLKVSDVVEKIHVSPSEDKVAPGLMEMILKFPCGTKSAVVTLEFDKGFLHIDEYPPDVNQGFDIPSAVISYPDFQASIQFLEDKSLETLPILAKLQEKSSVLSYTEVLLVPLTTPDFSMPYNVITITCTVFALYFGSLLNVLRRRVAEEERFLKSKDATKGSPVLQFLSKLSAKLTGRPLETPQPPSTSSSFISSKLILKVVLVAGIAVVWKFYLE
ncbi:GPI transamidase component PIG-T [Parasponia andersonii]|uniref:GPI transamidase component PIG-T n=1 Tax=Parasponia andersonii TaxID=3476 RepID=A0A2P5CCY9_PARAD|nr:GPI transamidase component PIG-T [Parasponia andersonii]